MKTLTATLSACGLASKGRWARSNLETSRVEIILQGSEIPKGVEVTPQKKKEKPEAKKEVKKAAPKEEKAEKKASEKEEKREEKPKPDLLKEEVKEHHEHKHEAEKPAENKMPHQHGEHDKR